MITKSLRSIIVGAVVFVVLTASLILYFEVFLLGGQRDLISEIDKQIQAKEDELIRIKSYANNPDQSPVAKKISKEYCQVEGFIVSLEQASSFSVYIGQIANEAGVKDFSSTNEIGRSYASINECEFISEGRMQVSFKGSYTQFAKFVNLLERNKPVVFVDYFRVRRTKKDDNLNDVDMVLTFLVGNEKLKKIANSSLFDRPGRIANKD